ncbi:hypothetical protein V497_02964 [Pseudogymnoascus sp. VKM F-4516 (FW-969)]|nr:hypothetical protein V497_02964 [Pseudogymnoascus sp. VKM F-4516 (FW-969)]
MFNSLLLTTAASLLLLTPVHAVCSGPGAAQYLDYGYCEDHIYHRYDPSNGEICDLLDCGGGRAPPKTNVPGCGDIPLPPYTASYMPCWTPGFTGAPGPAKTSIVGAATTSETAPEQTTAADAPSTLDIVAVDGASSTHEIIVIGTSTREETAAAPTPTEESENKSSSTVASTKASSSPETTAPAVLPSTMVPSGAQTAAANGTATSSGDMTPTGLADGTGAGAVVRGSVMAVVGAVVGVVMLV